MLLDHRCCNSDGAHQCGWVIDVTTVMGCCVTGVATLMGLIKVAGVIKVAVLMLRHRCCGADGDIKVAAWLLGH